MRNVPEIADGLNGQKTKFLGSDFLFDKVIDGKDKTRVCRRWLYAWERQNLEGLRKLTFTPSRWRGQVTLLIHSFQPNEEMFYVNEFPILHTWKMLGRLPVVIITDKETAPMSALKNRYPEDVAITTSPDLKRGDVLSLSRDCLKNLHKYFDTPYCLTIQDDGFPIRDNLDDFLGKWDYVGAPCVRDLPRQYIADLLLKDCLNGGFSLRTREYCVAVCEEWSRWGGRTAEKFGWNAEEDWFYSVRSRRNLFHRLRYRLPWASQARRFAAMDILGIVDLRKYRHVPFGIHSPTTCYFYRNELCGLGYDPLPGQDELEC